MQNFQYFIEQLSVLRALKSTFAICVGVCMCACACERVRGASLLMKQNRILLKCKLGGLCFVGAAEYLNQLRNVL